MPENGAVTLNMLTDFSEDDSTLSKEPKSVPTSKSDAQS